MPRAIIGQLYRCCEAVGRVQIEKDGRIPLAQ